MIIGFIGGQRSGKTAQAVFWAWYYWKFKNQAILTNMESLTFPHKKITGDHFKSKEKMQELIKGEKRFSILIDEAHLVLDSRTSKKNTAKTWLISQCGKLMEENGHFIYTTQFPNQIDKRLRYNTALYIHVEKIFSGGKMYFKNSFIKPIGDHAREHKKPVIKPASFFLRGLYERFEIVENEG